MAVVIRLIGLATGQPSPLDGQYVTDYDPCRDGTAPNGAAMYAYLTSTPDRDQARRYQDLVAAWNELGRVDQRQPVRPDGKPNRPIGAYSVAIEPAADQP